MVNQGDATPVQDIPAPEPYGDWDEEYRELLDKVDAGLAIVVSTKSDLSSYQGSDLHDDVLAYVIDESDFYVSSNGAFHKQDIGGNGNINTDQFVQVSGDKMEGKLDLSHPDAGLILPTK